MQFAPCECFELFWRVRQSMRSGGPDLCQLFQHMKGWISQFSSMLHSLRRVFCGLWRRKAGRSVWGLPPLTSDHGVEGFSAFQNTCEFMGLFLGVLGVRVLFPAVKRVALRGDSVTALTWCSKRSFKGAQVSIAVGLMLLILHGIQIVRVDHVPAEDNYLADALSRGYDVQK
jgi:hypothetical protein